MLHLEAIEPNTYELLRKLMSVSIFKDTRLVGGASLALQLGHRKSNDIDLFGTLNVTPEEIQNECCKIGSLEISRISSRSNIYWLDGVKVDCINYPYRWLDECKVVNDIRLASINDIAAMKINAIIRRGTKNDYVDLHFILKEMPLYQALDLYEQKYTDIPRNVAINCLTNFRHAEEDPMPCMFSDTRWYDIKHSICSEVKNYKCG